MPSEYNLKTCNLDYLFELAKGDMEFVKEMIQVYLEENSGELDNLGLQVKRKNFSQIRQIAHKLRSSIPYVGLDMLIGDEVQEMEELARQEKDIEIIEEYYRKIRKVSDEAIAELRAVKI
jgi:HPt (histidine-containing phosphotransfer) domain-containing protein